MTAEAPIDLDEFKFEDEDIYGEQIKTNLDDEPSTSETESLCTPTKKRKSPYSKTSHRRHPDDVDLEDRVLVSLVENGYSWEYVHLTNLS